MAFYFVSTFANAQTPTKQRPYGYRGLKIITSLKLRFQDFQRMKLYIALITLAMCLPTQLPKPVKKYINQNNIIVRIIKYETLSN
ncbi:hypothetical protein [Bathymodiolus japonicus methanotrophic gill symbiont]|uniref:hypothetical protein n=1 Tax=Bathymodiolus japonicus methanotrophic gill symbiont TaxID=113269 RepID=UPI001C8E584D|nr:hypothetical protein [Bathymodiolus japonicus methanotrophic gill symbiont]